LRRKSLKIPEAFKPFNPRFVRLLKRLLGPKPCQRSEVREDFKYMKDDWFRRKRPMTIGCHQFSVERQDGIKLKGSENGAKRYNSHFHDSSFSFNISSVVCPEQTSRAEYSTPVTPVQSSPEKLYSISFIVLPVNLKKLIGVSHQFVCVHIAPWPNTFLACTECKCKSYIDLIYNLA
jgi:hypothetical protein